MCVGAPKAPTPQPIPVRQPVIFPDNGDPSVIAGLKGQRRLTTSAMILTGKGGTLGSPSTTAPLGVTGS
jgi:hypothetical protein